MITTVKPRVAGAIGGMTLLELLVVIAIIGILMALMAPALQGMLRGMEMQKGASEFIDQFKVVRETARAKNRAVEMRIYQSADADSVRLYLVDESGAVGAAIQKEFKLPTAITISANPIWSSLLTDAVSGVSGSDSFGTYRAVRYRRDGSPCLSGTSDPTLTLLYRSDAGKSDLPPNFCTLQISLDNGIVKIFRRQ